ncbi:rhomboid family intramembrane serine protease [Mucilaginibacter sp. KACC 22063]|uniref:rhomboid family intramembrane serine protease n=1 Tax=Mucilaginibacter sp. KACC 22063 TaxID=3025666 RepID=UPI00236529FE|nr:rhomboid family intramembrane serine protease [Mucilaginibacter sp. KACC 22063]WDF56012.1 rhomboid family intramembrane serine protease [Mucilaginibacter sp. KACC 22063]
MSAYRQNPLANIPPVVKNLLILNVICFLPYIVFSEDFYDKNFIQNLGVFYFNSPLFKPWQLVTYMFFHGGWAHIIFNMFALYSFGMVIEYALGSKKFFQFYFICGLGAIALQMIVQAYEVYALTGHIMLDLHKDIPVDAAGMKKLQEIYFGPMVGASGAIFGLLVAFGMLFPNAELMILFIPVPVKAKYIIPVYIVIEIGLGISQFTGDSVAHFAHLGGAIIGFILIKLWRVQRPNNFF